MDDNNRKSDHKRAVYILSEGKWRRVHMADIRTGDTFGIKDFGEGHPLLAYVAVGDPYTREDAVTTIQCVDTEVDPDTGIHNLTTREVVSKEDLPRECFPLVRERLGGKVRRMTLEEKLSYVYDKCVRAERDMNNYAEAFDDVAESIGVRGVEEESDSHE